MKKIVFIFLIFKVLNLYSQQNLILNFTLIDFPYNYYAFQTYKQQPFASLSSPSMRQTIDFSASLVNSSLFLASKINFNITKSSFVNYLFSSAFYTGLYLVLEYIPGGIAWTHEEFHRSLLTLHNTPSYDETYNFKFLSTIIRVNQVADSNLIKFKFYDPQGFVRLHSAGIEGENVLAFRLYKQNFFYNQTFPYVAIATTSFLNSFYYIYMCQTEQAQITTEQENAKDGTNVLVRDFTGLDFTAWVYDLYNTFEPYQARGIHPSGVGIDRYIKPSDLTAEQLKLLKKQAFWHLINFVSPFTFGISKIPLKNSFFNFSFRHLLNPFGNDISFYLFWQKDVWNLIYAFHFYNNKFLTLPGLELQLIDYPIYLSNGSKLLNSLQANLFLQPKNLLYFDDKFFAGLYLNYFLKFGKKHFFPYLILTYKTKGWIAGEEFLKNIFKFGFGFSFYF